MQFGVEGVVLVDVVGQYVGWVEFVMGDVVGGIGCYVQIYVVGDVFVVIELVMQGVVVVYYLFVVQGQVVFDFVGVGMGGLVVDFELMYDIVYVKGVLVVFLVVVQGQVWQCVVVGVVGCVGLCIGDWVVGIGQYGGFRVFQCDVEVVMGVVDLCLVYEQYIIGWVDEVDGFWQ